ncbi:MAG TPA: hypothetical protein VHP56_08135 [Solirubrobacterales bacterium]|jgi:hypothetical protein|nr:hypothetical protein [Solirubrobacterales bacterium]
MSRDKTNKLRFSLAGALLCLGVWLAFPVGAGAAAPSWSISIDAFPSSFTAGSSGDPVEGPGYRIVAINSGDTAIAGPYTVKDKLPTDLSPSAGISGTAEVETSPGNFEPKPLSCEATGQQVTCTGSEAVKPGKKVEVIIPVDVASGASGESLRNEASIEGGGAFAKASLRTAVGQPAWKLVGIALPTNIKAGSKNGESVLTAVNVGGSASHDPITITDTLPEGLTPTRAEVRALKISTCPIVGRTVTCTVTESLPPGELMVVQIAMEADLTASGTLLNEAVIEGGGALPAATTTPIVISPSIATFGFLPGAAGFGALLTNADGSAATQAGSHPYQMTVELGWPSEKPSQVAPAGAVRDVVTDLPPGEILNPNSTSALCTEAQLTTNKCPVGSQIGMTTLTTAALETSVPIGPSPLYNMVPAPGTPSTFGFNAAELGIYVHIIGSLRSDGDYGLTGTSKDILATGIGPVLGFRLEFWGDPSSSSHDARRGKCVNSPEVDFCPAEEETTTSLLTAPVQCTGQPTVTRGLTDDWEESGVFKEATYESADLAGTPVAIDGCNQLQFEPTIEARPTTNLADSPSGLDVTVHQPQNENPGGNSTAIMKDLSLTLPAGLSVNPSSADGLGACTEAEANVHTLEASSCPADSKLGSVEVRTPLLNHPLPGALYLAKPFDNPSDSLVALYLGVDDPSTGTVANLAGRALLNPDTGQVTTIFKENPQLPIEDIKAHLFTGPRAALRTPSTCGSYSSTADISAWSAPQTADAHPSDSFAIGATPLGGSCPSSAAAVPNSAAFTAGTLSPQAGAYSPFVLHLNRPDGTQEPQRIETTLAPGLVAKLAGVSYCSEAQIAQARSREHVNQGALEKADPSCPASSLLGAVDVAAGAGPTPLHTSGHAYLAGPYKGAPLSLVVITPAIAGPFDLGAVVLRTALQVNPVTAQVTAVSDPLPRILEGIPLDIRGITIELNRSQFTLNPTSCEPLSITGALTSVEGTAAALTSPFQVGNCSALGFKPKLGISLKGGTTRGKNPALKAVVTYPPGSYANIANAQVTLPHSAFLDQGHINTVCTNPQFAAGACPPGSVYGFAKAWTPLLDQPLEGPVYLRTPGHELPDLVADLKGQIEVTLRGKVDSGKNNGIRNTFQLVPDAPVSKFVLEMKGGKKGLLVNSENICRKPQHALAFFTAQNGKKLKLSPRIANSCGGKKGAGQGAGKRTR